VQGESLTNEFLGVTARMAVLAATWSTRRRKGAGLLAVVRPVVAVWGFGQTPLPPARPPGPQA
jgi:hypothetical protein